MWGDGGPLLHLSAGFASARITSPYDEALLIRCSFVPLWVTNRLDVTWPDYSAYPSTLDLEIDAMQVSLGPIGDIARSCSVRCLDHTWQ